MDSEDSNAIALALNIGPVMGYENVKPGLINFSSL